MTDGVTITGGWQLVNRNVAVVIAGLDCGNYTLASDGTVFVPFGSDPDGLFTPSYLNSVSDPRSTNPALVSFSITDGGGDTLTVYVPVLIGYAYSSFAQVLRPKGEQIIKSQSGGGTGKRRRIYNYAMLLNNAVGLQVGTNSANSEPAQFRQLNDTLLTHDQMFSGIFYSALNDSHSFDGQLFWMVTRPYPCTILSVNSFMYVEEH